MGGLRDYLIRRILIVIPTLLVISAITFGIIHLAPGGPVAFMLEQVVDVTPEMIGRIEMELGLDQPIYVQYLVWLRNVLTGNIGKSFINEVPVAILIQGYSVNTLKLSLSSLFLSLVISVPLGVVAAVKKDSIVDNLSRVVALLGVSMPNFWTGLLLIYILGLRFSLFPVFGAQTIGATYPNIFASLLDQLYHLTLPMLVAAFGTAALTTRLVRSSMLEVLNQEYIMTARAKGVRERVVVYRHALRNALLPVVTVVGVSMGFLLSGAVTIEMVFAWPGLGRFAVESTFRRDYPAIMAMTLVVSLMVVLSNLITDIAYGLLDPRVRY